MKSALTVALVLLTGCSIALMDKPPSDPPKVYPRCSDTPSAPIADTVLSLLMVTATASAIGDNNNNDWVIPATFSVVFAASAILGFRWKSKCSSARSSFEHGPQTKPSVVPKPLPKPIYREGVAGTPCYANGTCNEGLYCEPQTRTCKPGHLGLEGGACFPDGSCTGNLVCTNNLCTEPPEAECSEDAHCPEGQTCANGYCLEAQP